MTLIIVFMIIAVLIAAAAVAGWIFFCRKNASSGSEIYEQPDRHNQTPACHMEFDGLHWSFTMNNRHPFFTFLGFLAYCGLGYIIFFLPGSYTYLPKYHSIKEPGADVWMLIIIFAVILLALAYDIVIGLVRSYPREIVFEDQQFAIIYSRGEKKHLPYSAVKDVEFKLWNWVRMTRIFSPVFCLYDKGAFENGRKAICRGEVPDKESYLLLSEQMKAHGLYYYEPEETMEVYAHARAGKPYNKK